MTLRDLVARAVAIGATPGVPASGGELAAAEARLGVRFDAQYGELMSIGSGLEGLGSWFLYPVSELGISRRWLESESFLVGEYFLPADQPSSMATGIAANIFAASSIRLRRDGPMS